MNGIQVILILVQKDSNKITQAAKWNSIFLDKVISIVFLLPCLSKNNRIFIWFFFISIYVNYINASV